jgi:phage major head subunit gpT-like protein
MLITQTNLQLFFTAFETRFWTAYGTAPVVYQKLATTYPVGTEQWVSGWLGMVDKMREWIGPRITHTPAPQTYLVPMQLFELTEGIDQFRLEDDTYGIYNPTVSFMGLQAAKWPDYQLRDLLQNQGSQGGFRQTGIDNLSYFNTAHPVDFWDASKGTFPNDYTAGGVTINSVLIGGGLASNAFATVWEDMARRKSESGEAWGVMPDLAVTGPMLKLPMDTILQAQFIGLPVIGTIGIGNTQTAGMPAPVNSPLIGASENMVKGWTDRLMWPDLGGSTAIGGGTYDSVWYVGDTSKPVRGLSWLLRQAPDFTYRIRPEDPVVFDTHTYQYGSKARGAPAWGFPQLFSRSGP